MMLTSNSASRDNNFFPQKIDNSKQAVAALIGAKAVVSGGDFRHNTTIGSMNIRGNIYINSQQEQSNDTNSLQPGNLEKLIIHPIEGVELPTKFYIDRIPKIIVGKFKDIPKQNTYVLDKNSHGWQLTHIRNDISQPLINIEEIKGLREILFDEWDKNDDLIHLEKNKKTAIKEIIKLYHSNVRSELCELNNLLDNSQTRPVVITAPGGFGKTQLARKYAEKYNHYYSGGEFLLNAKSSNMLLVSYQQLLMKFQENANTDFYKAINFSLLPPENLSEDEFSQLVQKYLDNWPKTLIIFDGASDYHTIKFFLRMVEISRKHHILITSQNNNWEKYAIKYELNKFSILDSIHYIISALKNGYKNESVSKQSAKKLSEILHCYPLALDKAVHTIGNNYSIKEYINAFCTPQAITKTFRLLDEKIMVERRNPYVATLLTWQASLQCIIKNCNVTEETIEKIFHFISSLDKGPVTKKIIIEYCKHTFSWEEMISLKFISECADINLFEIINFYKIKDSIQIQASFQEILFFSIREERIPPLLEQFANFFIAQFPYNVLSDKVVEWSKIYFHIEKLLDLMNIYKVNNLEIIFILKTFLSGYYVYEQYNPQRAKKNINTVMNILFDNSITVQDHILNDACQYAMQCSYSPEKEKDLLNLENLYKKVDLNVQDNTIIQKAILSFSKARYFYLKHDPVSYLLALNYIYQAEALMCVEEKSATKAIQRLVAKIKITEGELLVKTSKFEKAIQILIECLKKYEEIYGKNSRHPDISNVYFWLGTAYYRLRKLNEAEKYFEICKNFEKCFRSNNKYRLYGIYFMLGSINRYFYLLATAKKYFNKALAMIHTEICDETDKKEETAKIKRSLGVVALYQGDFKEAEMSFQDCLNIYEDKHITNKKSLQNEVALFHINLGDLYYFKKNIKEAEECYRKSLEIYEKIYANKSSLSEEDFDFARIYACLGKVYLKKKESHSLIENNILQIANNYLNESLSKYKKIFGEDIAHPEVAFVLYLLGRVEMKNNVKNIIKINDCFNKSLQIYQKAYTVNDHILDHPDIAMVLNALGKIYFKQEKFTEAKQYWEESMSIYKNVFLKEKSCYESEIEKIKINIQKCYQSLSISSENVLNKFSK